MDLKRFLETIYLGDRTCKSIIFDGWNETVRIHADCISRIRSSSGRCRRLVGGAHVIPDL